MDKYLIPSRAPQVPPYEAPLIAQGLTVELGKFLFPLLVELDSLLDKRLVRTFAHLIAVILTFRDRANGLLLSELGGYLLSPDHAPAGTKRLSNVLHSAKWTASIITADPVESSEQAWAVVFAYVRRWQIELSWKYEKSELAFQSPRVYEGEPREKLLLLATLAYAFLLTLLHVSYTVLRLWLWRSYCHRTGHQCRDTKMPLVRLRCALSRLWQAHPPNFAAVGAMPRLVRVSAVV